MPGGLFGRLKVWLNQDSVASDDLNGELDNVITHFAPNYIQGWEQNLSQMQETESPGAVGSEILGLSLADEIKQLRYMLNQIVGGAQWYSAPPSTLTAIAQTIDAQVPINRVQSGLVDAFNQPKFLVPNGANLTAAVKGSVTPFVAFIDGSQVTETADIVSANLTPAPSSGNTASSSFGSSDQTIILTTPGAGITALLGKIAAFKTGPEYFIGIVSKDSVGNFIIDHCQRNYLFDSTGNVIPPVTGATATITLMGLAWVYMTKNGTIAVSYTNPSYSLNAPSSPASGDFWYSFSTGKWSTYTGSSWIDANAVLVGIAVCDAATCPAARSFDFYRAYSDLNTIGLEVEDNSHVRSGNPGFAVSVYGTQFAVSEGKILWDSATDMESGSIGTGNYYLYIKDNGGVSISEIYPINRMHDLRGWYHPYKPWRCVGVANTDVSHHFSLAYCFQQKFYDVDLPNFSSSALTPQSVGSANVYTCGGPVRINLSAPAAAQAIALITTPPAILSSISASGSGTGTGYIGIARDGLMLTTFQIKNAVVPPGVIDFVDDQAGSGLHTYAIYAWVGNASDTIALTAALMSITDLGDDQRVS